jgi:hypothetical protein
MNLRSATYITAKEVKNKALNDEKEFEDLNNITINTDYDSEPNFDFSDNNAFDLILNNDYNTTNDFINVK